MKRSMTIKAKHRQLRAGARTRYDHVVVTRVSGAVFAYLRARARADGMTRAGWLRAHLTKIAGERMRVAVEEAQASRRRYQGEG